MQTKPILIVDDEEGIRSMFRTALEMYHYRVSTAANGQEALEILRHEEAPCLILLDLMMPVMNGWKLAEALLHNPNWAKIPLVVISAFPNRGDTFPNAQATLSKPIEFDDLISTVEKFCGKAA